MKPGVDIERKLTRARTQLLLNQPFFGSLCLRLKLTPDDVPSMATDGRRIVYDPSFVDLLKPAELEAVLAHEVMHCALGHHCRRGAREPALWNRAADLAINPILIANGFTLPEGALLDPQFSNLSAEEIYARLMDRKSSQSQRAPQQGPQHDQSPNSGGGTQPSTQAAQNAGANTGATCDSPQVKDPHAGESRNQYEPGRFGEVRDSTDEDGKAASAAEKNRQQHEWSIAADQAMRVSKSCGSQPLGIDRALCDSRESHRDWRTILRSFISARAPADYRWSPPNRRYIASGLYLPSVERSGLRSIVIAIDTSGSIRQRELEQFAGEISAIAEEARPESIHVIYCDAAVQGSEEFRESEPIKLEPKGGGGTNFCPAFEWVAERAIDPVCLIYLTDLCCYLYPECPPGYPVLWVTNSRRVAPFGETVRIESE